MSLIVLLFAGVLQAEQSSDVNELRVLADYIRYAMLNSAELRASFEQWKAALEQVPQAKALDDPKFTYGYFINEVETRVGPQRHKISVMQVFPWFGEIEARADVAAAKAKAARQKYETAKLKLVRQVKDRFYEYAYLAVAIEIAKENLELLTRFEEVARQSYRTATASHPDVIRAQMELAKIEDVLKSLEKLREPTAAKINSILNRPATTALAWPTKEQLVQIHISQQQAINMLVEANPELAGLDWEIEAAKSNVELAKKKFYPDVGVGVDWIQTDSAIMSGTRDSGKDPVMLTFSMNIPLWRDSYSAAEQQAQANLRKTQNEKTDAENKKTAQAIQLLYDIEDSQRKIDLYGLVLIPKAEQLVQASESAYKSGGVDFLSLIDAQRMHLKYRLEYEQAVTNYQKKLAELETLIGKEL